MAHESSTARADVERGRRYYEQRRWADACDALLRAREEAPLERADLDRLVWSAALRGDDDELLRSLELLYQTGADAGDRRLAARAAFWIGFRLFALAAPGRASGWLARAQRQIDDEGDCAERGYLLLPTVFRHLGGGDHAAAEAVARQAAEIGERCQEADLVAIARNLEGRALLRQGRVEPGLALIDEVMLAATSGELSPLVTGLVYCNVITTCQQVYAFDRAREWTAALASWCEEQPQLVTFTGNCLVYRSEVLQLGGDWPAALAEVRQVCERLCEDEDPEVFANACYQRGELLRLRGGVLGSGSGLPARQPGRPRPATRIGAPAPRAGPARGCRQRHRAGGFHHDAALAAGARAAGDGGDHAGRR
jgi:tetratricopeptide (TPR) repeat protein